MSTKTDNTMFNHLCIFIYMIFNLAKVYGMNNGDEIHKYGNPTSNLKHVSDWPRDHINLGQLSAVSLNSEGNVVVFHRGYRIWDFKTFSIGNVFANINEGPISVDTIVVLNSSVGYIVESWGKNLFYLPHGLTIDKDNNIWVTDVAMHQVFKFSARKHENLLTLGTKLVPGNDKNHFCKPTSIAITSQGDFFVADGYCNSRIIKFTSDGAVLQQWGTNNFKGPMKLSHFTLSIPHALALINDEQELCVADRENSRIVCYNSLNATFTWQYQLPANEHIYSVAYAPVNNGQLYFVNGPISSNNARGFVLNIHNNVFVSNFGYNLMHPHDIAVSADGSEVYVVELDPYVVHKYASNVQAHFTVASTEIWKTEKIWIIKIAATLAFLLFFTCLSIMWYRISKRKKDELLDVWKRSATIDKVFRLDKLTERQNIGQGFQRLKTDESDEETIATVNI